MRNVKKNAVKSILSWLLVFSMVFSLMSSVVYTQAADSDVLNYDAMPMNEILKLNKSLTWVIAGDSITHCGSWTAGLNSYGEWMEQCLYDIGRGDDSVVLNGWGGAKIQHYVKGYSKTDHTGLGLEDMITKYNPDVVTIKLGMNNRYDAKESFKNLYTQMLQDLYSICEEKYNKIPKVVILTPTPIASENLLDDAKLGEPADNVYESTLRQRNALEEIVTEYNNKGKHILFCDLRTAFLEEAQTLGADYANTFFTDPSDGAIHPNGAGQYYIFETLAKTLGIYDETMPIFQIEYDDLTSHALYVDGTENVTYTGDYDNADVDAAEQVEELSSEPVAVEKTDWSDAAFTNATWAVAGGAQLSGYEGITVNRSLMRYIECTMRGGGWGDANYRNVRMYNLASADYDVATLVSKFDELTTNRAYDVFMLLPEVPDVYESNYVHSASVVAAYKANVESLISKNSSKVIVLWTPLASNDTIVNSYIDDYANAVREIAGSNTKLLFFDANQFMNDNMKSNSSLLNNWFEDGQYISPLCSVDVARAFYETMSLSGGTGKGELRNHNLRYTSDAKTYKGSYVRDYIAAKATVDGTQVSIDVRDIVGAYPNAELSIAVLPYKTVENYNEDIVNLTDVAEVAASENVYTFEAPCADLNLAIYGKQDGVIYRFKDISLDVETTATIPEAKADGVYLDSLEVMSAPEIGFTKNTTTYTVNLYQYQTYASVRATAQAGLTIKVNDNTVASGAISKAIKVEDGSVIEVEVTNGTETKTYTLQCTKPKNPDIIITEVMTDGYKNHTKRGNDNYELVEIYNASGKELNLLDYSIGYKKDYTYNTVTVGNGAEFPYYFTGNDVALSKETHAGIKEITKYSMYWKDKVDNEPERVIFPADSTMVIWIKYSPQKTQAEREEYGAALTYETLIAALKAHMGTKTLSVDIDGVETAVVPGESQLVVAEVKTDMASGSIGSAASVTAENSQKNWYLENHSEYNVSGDSVNLTGQHTRSWLFILKDTAEVAQNGKVTEAGNDIISAAKYVRPGSTDKLSSVFSYNYERGMSLVKNESVIDDTLIGESNTSDVSGYSNLTSFGAIEYWQKPTDFGDVTAPTVKNNTTSQLVSGAEGVISLELSDDADVRYVEVYARKAGDDAFTKIATKDLVLEAGVLNKGLSADITSYAYTCSVGEVTGTVEYYVTVEDGNGNVTSEGTADEPCTISLFPKVVEPYTVEAAEEFVRKQAPECSQSGYLFSGWYADEACTESPLQSLEGVSGTVYALFVTEDALSVKAQISPNLIDNVNTNDATGSIRFVTTVDSLWYLKVGFYVSYEKSGETVNSELSSMKVYEKLYYVAETSGETMSYEPTEFSSVSKYFKACTILNVPQSAYDTIFTVTPFWITPDGIPVTGVTAQKSVDEGIIYEAKIGDVYYDELEDAVAAANLNNDDTTIVVLKNVEVESQLEITTNITIQNREGLFVTLYRGENLAAATMFNVAKGVTLTIKGTENAASLVLDGRTTAEAKASTGVKQASGSTKSLITNNGNVKLENVTAQYVRRTTGNGSVVENPKNASATLEISDAIIRNCSADADDSQGGAIYFGTSNGTSVFKNTTFESNYAQHNGGAVANNSPLYITDCTFDENVTAANGGAIYNGGNAKVTITGTDVAKAVFKNNESTGSSRYGGAIGIGSGQLVLKGYKFENNTAASQGGAIYVTGSNDVYSTITECEFTMNSANEAGALHVGNSGDVTVKDSKFTGNSAATNGGAVSNDKAGAFNIYSSTFTSNSTLTNGGAIYVNCTGTVLVKGSTFDGNETTKNNGGAIYVNGKSIDVQETTFKNNYATNRGGAVCVEGGTANFKACDFINNECKNDGGGLRMANQATVTLTDGKFENNTAGNGGGAIQFNSGTLTVTNYVFTDNTSPQGNTIRMNSAGTTFIRCTLSKSDIYLNSTTATYVDGGNTWLEDEE